MEILILFGLILLNGVFAMSEIAIVTARKARLAKMASEGSRSAAIALKLGEDPTHFLSAVQIGITSIGLLNGIYGESLLAQPFALWLQEWGLSPKSSSLLATVIVVVLVTYLSIVVGELVPKRLGQLSAERIACLVARPMLWLATLTRPFVWLLSASTNASLRLLRVDQRSSNNVTQEEIHAMLVEGSEAGVIEDHEHTMLRNVFRLDERSLASLMVPRSDIRLNGGRELQRCLYAFAVKALLGDDVAISASLLYPREPVDLQLDDPEAVLEEITGYLRAARSSLAEGAALPGPDTGGDYDDLAFALPANASATYCKRKMPAATERLGEVAQVWEAE